MDRLNKLKELEAKLYTAMQSCEYKELAAISRQYRETIKEIENVEGIKQDNDEVAKILADRSNNGKAGAVRKNRTKV